MLSCCIEIQNALKSEDPSAYVSYLPVHQVKFDSMRVLYVTLCNLQDGSCNGLQHYSALGRDVLGAKKVCILQFIASDMVMLFR